MKNIKNKVLLKDQGSPSPKPRPRRLRASRPEPSPKPKRGLVRIHNVNGVKVVEGHCSCGACLIHGHNVDPRIPKMSNIWNCGKCGGTFFREL
jgi:hypothetical protein